MSNESNTSRASVDVHCLMDVDTGVPVFHIVPTNPVTGHETPCFCQACQDSVVLSEEEPTVVYSEEELSEDEPEWWCRRYGRYGAAQGWIRYRALSNRSGLASW